jgi:hypothetical protein
MNSRDPRSLEARCIYTEAPEASRCVPRARWHAGAALVSPVIAIPSATADSVAEAQRD